MKGIRSRRQPVPEFEYTPRSVAHLHGLLTVSKAKDEIARLVTRDYGQWHPSTDPKFRF
ncbi:hypothetical protein PIB30_022491 [Stylosanthes scabra]|uniref:Uncharacterized protein n=1 Tax=Stylosanthes scabra TaxID=79078 RepID=A0ABU6U838_9FABA|nr:hypothetical protein [Stylosanthes scabra]